MKNIKILTRINDLNALLNKRGAAKSLDTSIETIVSSIRDGGDFVRETQSVISAREAAAAAAVIYKKIPATRRESAEDTLKTASEIADGARKLGGCYSGTTCCSTSWGTAASAETDLDRGVTYSSSCLYSKTDATHIVRLDAAGIPLLVDAVALRAQSIASGRHLIALYPEGRAVWVIEKSGSKKIASEAGWIVSENGVCAYSTESREHALMLLNKQLNQLKKAA